ncbi:PREDICTED: zinc finger CCHC domain-containing protein 8 homolog isoform X2 [Vollenhovia emeryi]|uniref:zinc finger CCHC domain-containing protein 8 homolog isoform X2 n=1 Tax=Vollenhovia emeryi TaxID=411798 RepID=UPI0005F571C6|nr:PREDICTED: zinc finger CCHC domain-containing protein 8 homolog isoform X2 [Vollenhovia emeryi]
MQIAGVTLRQRTDTRAQHRATQYRAQVKDFLQSLLRARPLCKKNANESDLTLEIWENEIDSEEMFINLEDENTGHDSVECIDNFTIDKRPNINDLAVPTYEQKYENTFEKPNATPRDFTPKLNCFNCNGNHNLRDCQLPKNQSNINKNRKEFAMRNNMGVRYHMSEDQRYSHMIPGQLSQKLRDALGVKDNQLPRHIYRMRLLGYPPGWLEEARLQHSGLSLFISGGADESDINKEDGEIITSADRDQYDLKKIYDFPGFNVLPPPGTEDDSRKYWVPQMQFMHSKQMMLSHLQGKEADDGYKRKKLKLPAPVMNNTEMISDMEVEDTEENVGANISVNGHFVPPLPKESTQLQPPAPLDLCETITSNSDLHELFSFKSADDTPSSTYLSLFELERRKKMLLMEIEETNSQSNSDSISIKTEPETSLSFGTTTPSTLRRSPNRDSVKSDLTDVLLTNDCNTTLDMSVSDKMLQSTPIRSTSQKSSEANHASVKSVHLGTPILSSTSPYSKLPSSEKFSKDICDVINFENLPDSTGKYEQMSGVLRKVRSTMTRLHQQE